MSRITATMLQDRLNDIERNICDGIDFRQELNEAYALADELEAENAKLRAERDEWRRVAVSKQDIIDHMRDANAENAKLRELVGRYDSALEHMCDQTQGFYSQSDLHPCDECELGKGYGFDKCGISELQEGARELGIEVD